MGCLMSCSSSAKKTTTTTLPPPMIPPPPSPPLQGMSAARCLAKKPNPTAEIHNGTTTHRKGKGVRRQRQDDIPKLPKTFFTMGQQSSEGNRPFTPTTADPFSESIAESTESPIHSGI
ncbi:unnamed protein product [Linum trigynum]|uniref:Uncharacterized protein n=1 Tax=Linum trigynum TaxID=586398 RepID=A0AAV2GL43_9ROSI